MRQSITAGAGSRSNASCRAAGGRFAILHRGRALGFGCSTRRHSGLAECVGRRGRRSRLAVEGAAQQPEIAPAEPLLQRLPEQIGRVESRKRLDLAPVGVPVLEWVVYRIGVGRELARVGEEVCELLRLAFLDLSAGRIDPQEAADRGVVVAGAEVTEAGFQTALLAREEPKDLADIWGFCCQKNLSLQNAITDAQSKAAGVFPADLARVLISTKEADWKAIRWIQAPPAETFITQLNQLGESLLLIR